MSPVLQAAEGGGLPGGPNGAVERLIQVRTVLLLCSDCAEHVDPLTALCCHMGCTASQQMSNSDSITKVTGVASAAPT